MEFKVEFCCPDRFSKLLRPDVLSKQPFADSHLLREPTGSGEILFNGDVLYMGPFGYEPATLESFLETLSQGGR